MAGSERSFSKDRMGSPALRRCPDCGAVVSMCADVGQTPAHCDDRRLDQVTRALCGCWVMRLPESHVIGLTCAIMAGDE
ncbi:MAG: hypothetical protein LLG45_03430, partial [Actinomycetia bacterium]|nr:hypothetical protein [Actinomycetes bacterium]